jgi:hypothetical protein
MAGPFVIALSYAAATGAWALARSSERYWMASLMCAVVISPPPYRSAMVRAILSTR